MWGQVSHDNGEMCEVRIIPTRVGTRIILISLLVTTKDHPHACGDKQGYTAKPITAEGSSPRVWGQAVPKILEKLPERIIPTRVGTSILKLRLLDGLTDHPHACGDKLSSQHLVFYHAGSSPRVWGQDFATAEQNLQHRIIPTRVGTSDKNISENNVSWDHPHACGDKERLGGYAVGKSGSSPRVWGQAICFTSCP